METPTDTPKQSQEASTEVSEALPEPGPYELYVQGLLTHWPYLRVVTDFMSVNLKDTPTPFTKRMFKTDVRVIDVINDSKYQPHSGTYTTTTLEDTQFSDLTEFQNFLKKPRNNGSKTVILRFIMAEDLSAGLIETLGSTFNLDPDFFAQHLGEWLRYYKGYFSDASERAGYAPRPHCHIIRVKPFQHYMFQRVYEWQGEDWIKKTSLANSNLWRPHISRGIKQEVFVDERFSATSFGGSVGWTEIYLFDPLLQLLTPRLYGGMPNFRTKPLFVPQPNQTPVPAESSQKLFQPDDSIFPFPLGPGPPRYSYKSLRDETANYVLRMPVSTLASFYNRCYCGEPLRLPFQVMLSSWALVASVLNRKMEELEELEEHIAVDTEIDLTSNPDIPIRFVTLRKHAREFAQALECTVSNFGKYTQPYFPTSDLQLEAQLLITEFTKMATRGNFNVPKLHTKGPVRETKEIPAKEEISKQESIFTREEASVQVEAARRLAILAAVFVFVPIASIATVLSIWPWMKYCIFVGLSLPILILTHLLSKEFKGLRIHVTWDKIEKKPVTLQQPTVLSERHEKTEIPPPLGNHLDTAE